MTTRVQVPVEFFADYEDGKITRLVVLPLESAAYYFGAGSCVIEGDESLDVKDSDGPFWRAMQGALGSVPIDWEE